MQIDKSLHELIEAVRVIIAKDMAGKPPLPRRKPVADPALWRAIQNQQSIGHAALSGYTPSEPLDKT
jgi:hypothetical protein